MAYVMRPIPAGLDPSLHDRWRALEQAIKANEEMEASLQQVVAPYGGHVEVTLASIVSSRLQCLIDVLLPFDGGRKVQEQRLEVDELLQKQAAEFLAQAKSGVIKQLIAAGANIPKSLLDQMAAQQGLGKGLLRG